ncbi:TaqI-like C-terminal specificity domain-containing protein [Thioalkalivibrio sp. HK1]|uniref:TaqI-like C-terminal specificity domain-containing protein n=1 Tax=Thioalkalivibrio sp. HK1 TaxID=1469245 RepID=UPI0009E0AE75|nr:TaqI-like C-terminal specificity domain-containing protein [Thioalkalivibrio sp. HK1]
MYYGIKTGYNDAFIIDKETKDALIQEDPRSEEIIKPILRGRDIGRYKTEEIKEYLIGTHNGYRNAPRIDVKNYPAIKKHLDKHYHEINIRQDQGATPYNLRNCAYYGEFEKEKIAYSDISTSPRFYLDRKNIYFTNTAYILTGQNLIFLLGVLNSKLFTFIFKQFYAGGGLGDHGYRYFKLFLENVPIPYPSKRKTIIKKQVEKYVECIMDDVSIGQRNEILDSRIDQLIYEYYELTDKEINLTIKGMKN